VAWHSLGWEPAFFSEIEPFPSAVLAHHYQNTPNVGDMNLFYERAKHDAGYVESLGHIDLVCAGTPCQSFSLAGLRKGLDDPRGNLALVYLGIVERIKPTWVVWENVPGVLSLWSAVGEADENGEWEETNDFTTFLAALGELGYGYAWRILDAQHFGVPQRRRRVFVVGYLGDWRRAAAVLFERESVSRYPSPGKRSGKAVAALTANGVGTCGADDTQCQSGHIMIATGQSNAEISEDASSTLNCNHEAPIIFDSKQSVTQRSVPGPLSNTLDTDAGSLAVMVDFQNNAIDDVSQTLQSQNKSYSLNSLPSVMCLQSGDGIAPTLTAPNTTKSVVDGKRQDGSRQDKQPIVFQDKASTLTAGYSKNWNDGMSESMLVSSKSNLRRITPVEAERLQGFLDNYTLIPFKKKKAADGPRYKAIGNSMAVPVMKWLGERIQLVQDLIDNKEI
jgi:DNA (cytosine-5)-methyltransferase 1